MESSQKYANEDELMPDANGIERVASSVPASVHDSADDESEGEMIAIGGGHDEEMDRPIPEEDEM